MKHYEQYLFSEGKSENTIKQYMRVVNKLDKWLLKEYQIKLLECEAMHLQYYKSSLLGYEPTTINNYINAIRHYFQYLKIQGEIKYDPSVSLKEVKIQKVKQANVLDDKEKKKLIILLNQNEKFIRNKWIATRNRAIIYTFLFAGLRRSEVAELLLADVTKDYLIIRDSKFEKYRTIPMNSILYAAIEQWLEVRKDEDEKYLFLSQKKGQLTISGINNVFASLQKNGYNIHPNMLRHYFATDLIRRNHSLNTVKELLGHNDIRTTQRYVDTSIEDMKNAINSLTE